MPASSSPERPDYVLVASHWKRGKRERLSPAESMHIRTVYGVLYCDAVNKRSGGTGLWLDDAQSRGPSPDPSPRPPVTPLGEDRVSASRLMVRGEAPYLQQELLLLFLLVSLRS